jgi:hypothetical protein
VTRPAPPGAASPTAFAAAMTAMLVATAGPATADPLPRVAHVSRALAAVRSLGPSGRDRLERELATAARARCHADTGTPAAACLIAAARAICAADPDRTRCEAAADVIATNLRAAPAFVDEPTRIRLVRGSADYRTALAAELRRHHAALATELVLARGGADDDAALPASIDTACLDRDRAIHACQAGDAACVPSVPWSRCVAALIWFVGAAP